EKAAQWKAQLVQQITHTTESALRVILEAASSYMLASYISAEDSTLTATDYLLYSSVMKTAFSPLSTAMFCISSITMYSTNANKFFDLLNEKPEVTDAPDAVELVPKGASIELNDVSFHYDPKVPVLKKLSFSVNSGEKVGIIGASGCGKSTLMRLLFRFYDVNKGRILIGGHDIRTLKLSSLRRTLGIVPQDTQLFNESISYNIRYGRPDASQEEPEGYDTRLGRTGIQLSGGQRQRIAIARVLLKQPEFILLDEATSSLDSATERDIQKSLATLCEGKTSIIVAHRLSTIRHADKIVVVKDGSVAECGRHEDLLALDGLYAEMWKIQNGQ
ncbi:hypothetical protein AAVH_41194, partial [Aphelenchoides avenae]